MQGPADEGARQMCTGLLISPRHVLTAAHCVVVPTRSLTASQTVLRATTTRVCFAPDPLEEFCNISGCGVRVRGGARCVDVLDCAANPAYNRPEEGSYCGFFQSSFCHRPHADVAVLFLATPVAVAWAPVHSDGPGDRSAYLLDTPVTFARLPTEAQLASLVSGASLTQVAYGPDGSARVLPTRRFRANRVESLTLSGGEIGIVPRTSALFRGDSGSPVFGPIAADPVWGLPPLGVAACGAGPPPFRGQYAGLNEPSNLAFVRSQLDQDGDGRLDYGRLRRVPPPGGEVDDPPDIRPVGCPGRGFSPAATPTTDTDGDGYVDTEDSLPNYYDPCDLNDADRDGVPSESDNCPIDYNPDQADFDGDTHGDVCDNCWETPNTDQRDVDIEMPTGFEPSLGDGVGDVCDVCPDTLDPLQEDCDGNGLGDACDFPDEDMDGRHDVCDDNCPVFNPGQLNCNLEAEMLLSAPIRGDACDPTPCADFRPHAVRDALGPGRWIVSSQGLLGLGRAVDTDEGVGVGSARTGFRSCPCAQATTDDIAAREDCSELPPLGGGCRLADSLEYDSPFSRWRPVRGLFLFGEHDVGNETSGPEFVIRYGGVDATSRFGRAPFGDAPMILWTSTRGYEPRPIGPIGSGEPDERYGCVATGTCSTVDRSLASHYWSGAGRSAVVIDTNRRIEPFDASVLLPPGICPVCESGFPLPSFARACEASTGSNLCLRIGAEGPQDPVLDLALSDALIVPLPAGLANALADPTMEWLPALESSYRLARDAISLAGFDDKGFLRIALRLEDGELGYAIGPGPMEPVAQTGARFLLGNRRTLTTLDGGGSLRVTHLGLDRPGGVSTQYLYGQPPQAIEAVALGSAGELVLIDVDTDQRRRIVVVDLERGTSTVVATFDGCRDHYALSATPDGQIAMLSWDEAEPGWRLHTFWIEGSGLERTYRAIGAASGDAAVRGAFRASGTGLTFVVDDPVSGGVPVGVPYSSLDPSDGLEDAF